MKSIETKKTGPKNKILRAFLADNADQLLDTRLKVVVTCSHFSE